MIIPACVARIVSVGELVGSDSPEGGATAARPKSSTLTTPAGVTMMLAGCVARTVHLAHASRADRRKDFVRTQLSPRRERHRLMNDFNLRVGRSQRIGPGKRWIRIGFSEAAAAATPSRLTFAFLQRIR